MSVPIYILAWNRLDMTERCLREIAERTRMPHEVHLFVNEAWSERSDIDRILRMSDYYTSVHFDKRNTACLYPKYVQHAMTCTSEPYYVVNDHDYFPPDLGSRCWLTRMVEEMHLYNHLGILAAQLPPQHMQEPIEVMENHVLCKAVGNSLKLVRRVAFPADILEQEVGKFGDDSYVCDLIQSKGFYHTAFSREVFCLHGGQMENWGYTKEQLDRDPRKAGYDEPYTYVYDIGTYVPEDPNLRM